MSRDNAYLIGNQFAKDQPPNKTAFKKGGVPWNKGMQGLVIPGSEKTRFKKGATPANRLFDGALTIRTDKNGARRRWIRVGGKWVMYATWLWEKEKGPLPLKTFVHHIDGDSLNDVVDNYAVVTRRSHMELHRQQLLKGRLRDGDRIGKGYIRKL